MHIRVLCYGRHVTVACAKQIIHYSTKKLSRRRSGGDCIALRVRGIEALGFSGHQVSMSQRQQQHSAVQHAVRQALSPLLSLCRSSTTYTEKGKTQMLEVVYTPQAAISPGIETSIGDFCKKPVSPLKYLHSLGHTRLDKQKKLLLALLVLGFRM